ncbi:MAG: autotransporter-associated beta strand repeat-containing protein, partial [Verrucomicrobiota bacterium]
DEGSNRSINLAASGSGAVQVVTSGVTLTLNGAISGGGSLSMNGAGDLLLGGSTNTYSGGTNINSGTLTIANSSGSATGTGNVTMNGGVLASSGATAAISGNVIDGGTSAYTIAPGGVGTVGTLTLGGLTATSLGTLNFDLGTGSGEITNGDLLVLGSGTVSVARRWWAMIIASSEIRAAARLSMRFHWAISLFPPPRPAIRFH